MSIGLGGNALVTGAGSGIGRAVALLYAREGVDGLTIADYNEKSLAETEQLIREISSTVKVAVAVTDVTNAASVDELVAKAQTLGDLNYAANIAGISPKKQSTFTTESIEDYDAIQNVNARGVFLCMQAELRVMLKQEPRPSPLKYQTSHTSERGSIVNMASVAGLFGLTGLVSYVASKHACVGLSRTAAVEHGRALIRVNAVCPSYIDTPMAQNMVLRKGLDDEKTRAHWNTINSRNPAGRLGTAEEVAEACVFLTSHRATFISGQTLSVDGAMGGSLSYQVPV